MFPNCGKILIIDDNIEEALPLINLLSRNGISSSYYSGAYDDFPREPFADVRLVFCDLRFNAAPDVKSVVSTVVSILQKLIGNNNGPYILIIWSSHIPDYLQELKLVVSKTDINPAFILELDKTKYFSSSISSGEDLQRKILELGLDYEDERKVLDLIQIDEQSIKYQPNSNALSDIENELLRELEKANLLHLFVIWENAISKSAIETVNNIYNEILEEVPAEKRLNAMLYYLSHYQLEKQFDVSTEEEKFSAAIMTLNHLFNYFCEDAIKKVWESKPHLEIIEGIEEIRHLSKAKFNRWSTIKLPVLRNTPGNIYDDPGRLFRFHGWIYCDYKTNRELYDRKCSQILSDDKIKYVVMDISAECDIAQRKQFVAKLIPGIIIPVETYEKYEKEKMLKNFNCTPEYFFKIGPVEYEDIESTLEVFFVFNLNQLQPIDISSMVEKKPILCLSNATVSSIKQHVSMCISKAGTASFG